MAATGDPNSPLAASRPLSEAPRDAAAPAPLPLGCCRAAVKIYNLTPAMAKVVGSATATRAVCMQKL